MNKKFKVFVLIILMIFLFTYNNVSASTKVYYGIVLNAKVDIKEKASSSSKTIYQVKRGTILNVVGQSGNYYKAISTTKKVGYVEKKKVAATYILVDISDQKLYYYNNGVKKWTVNVVTGQKGTHDTPVGHYTLIKRWFRTDKNLGGGYHVDYWMPFITDKGIGFHDAAWRNDSDYKASTYLTNGSHGCVNMKRSDAKKLYENAPASIDVIVRK